MKQVGDPETSLKLEQGAGRAVVADPSLGSRGVEDQVGVAQQAFYRRARDRALGVVVEDDPALPVGECHEPDPDAVAVRDRLLQTGLRSQLVDTPVNRLGRRARYVRRDRVL